MVGVSDPSKPLGRTHWSFSRTQAEQGHVFVVAASHLIFRLRQPSHALITAYRVSGGGSARAAATAPGGSPNPLIACGDCVRRRRHNLRAGQRSCIVVGRRVADRYVTARGRAQAAKGCALFWVCGVCWGAKLKVPICELWGSILLAEGSLDMAKVGMSGEAAPSHRTTATCRRGREESYQGMYVVRRVLLELGAVAAGGNGHAGEKSSAIQVGGYPWSVKAG